MKAKTESVRKGKRKVKDKIFGVLQRIGRSFMLPIAILPVAGLLLGIGSSFTNETTIATYEMCIRDRCICEIRGGGYL